MDSNATQADVCSSDGLGLEPERAAFEAWFSENGAYPKAVERVGEFYKLSAAAAAWRAWSVCWPVAVAAERERCAKIVGKYGPSDFNDLGQILVEIHGA